MDARMVDRLRRLPPEVLGSRIKSARIAMGLTQLGLAQGDVTISFVSRIESGKRRLDPTLLERFSGRLDVTVSDLLADEVDMTAPSVAQVEIDFGEIALRTGDADGALVRVEAVLLGNDDLSVVDRARAGFLRARALEATGDVLGAIDTLEPLAAAEAAPNRRLALGIALSRCYRAAGDLTRAITTGEELRSRLADRGLAESAEAGQLAVIVAAAHAEQGDVERAVQLCREAPDLADKSARVRASAYWTAGIRELDAGDPTSAAALARRALAVLGDGEDARALARLRTDLGTLLLRLDVPPVSEATELLLAAHRTLRETDGDAIDLARTQVALARSLTLEKRYAEAESTALACTEELAGRAPLLDAEALYVASQAADGRGDAERSRAHLVVVVERLTEVGAHRAAGPLWMDVGDLLTGLGDAEGAARAYRSAAASTGLLLRTPTRVPLPSH